MKLKIPSKESLREKIKPVNPLNEILFVSSFPPRECGIATYTQDLMQAIGQKFGKSFSLKVCALENSTQKRGYGEKVKYILNTSSHSQYIDVSEKINRDKNIKAVFVQHEFGLFSGEYGENLLSFLYTLHKPIITSFHTVLPNPDSKRRDVVKAIVTASDSIIVMTENSKRILENEYFVPAEKISVIHHGTHLVACPERNTIKIRFNLSGKHVLSTFGLLSSGKCIETALDALPSVIAKFPNTVYMVIGKTHPEVVKHEGEKYREFLETKVCELGIRKHVKFVNRYLSLEDLLEYLQLTDVYLFTSKDPNQAVSGTFSYAMGCSCPVISTPIPHAKEMLSDNAGIIVDFQNPKQLADAAIELLSNPKKRREMSLNALHKIRPTAWQNSAVAHVELFKKIMKTEQPIKYSIPEISLNHIKKMTTESGIIQFSDICRPDLNSGYTLDDNARALIATIKHYELTGEPADVMLIDVYLNFIKFAQQNDGSFLNYVDKYGNYHEKNKYVNLEDSMGRAIWALGEFISRGHLLHGYFSNRAEGVMKESLTVIRQFESPRAIAFVIKGLYSYNLKNKNPFITNLISELADKLTSCYHKSSDSSWKWFEEYLTYANSVLPESLLCAYLATENELYKQIAKLSFDFLLAITFVDKKIKVISNRGWHKKGEAKNHFGEQPIDVAYTISSLDLFYEVFGDEEYRNKIETAFSWFHGNNHLHQIIYNPATGGCQDGLEEHNVNLNQGAESAVCYLLARVIMKKYIEVKDGVEEKKLTYIPIASEYGKEKIYIK
ncbi:MAG: glycosyltransferase [Bacteroidetes bacterium]|nr:MAG: glycosyltransferase [Bacteroidota bacterium]